MIGYGMFYAVAVGLPILLAALIGSGFFRRHGRPERGVWLLAVGLALTLPVFTILRPSGAGSAASIPVPETGVMGLPSVLAVPAVPVAQSAIGLEEILLGLWILASVMLAVRWAVSAFRLARRSGSWRSEALDGVRVWLTSDLGPAVSGIARPRIVVPSWVSRLPRPQRALVLLHEQEHLQAGDHWLIALSRIARILTPWNPVVWLLTLRLGRAIELDCDRRVLRRHPDVQAYGATLLMVSARGSHRLLAAAAFAESEVGLRRRILVMTTPPSTVSVLGLLTTLLLGVVLLIGAFEVPIPAIRIQVDIEPPSSGVTPSLTAESANLVVDGDGLVLARLLQLGLTDNEVRARLRAAGLPSTSLDQFLWEGVFGPDNRMVTLISGPDSITSGVSILNLTEVLAAMQAVDAGVGGTARVALFIDYDGTVQEMRLSSSSGRYSLDSAARSVAGVFRFSPATSRERAVPVWVIIPITFGREA